MLEKPTCLQLYRSLCTQFFHTRGVRIIQKQSSKQYKYMTEKALWLAAHTTTQNEREASLYPFFQALALQCAIPPWKMVKYEHLTVLQRGPRSWAKTKEPQQAFLLQACQRQRLQSSDVWREGRRTAKIPAVRSCSDKRSRTHAHGNLRQQHESLHSPSTFQLQQG